MNYGQIKNYALQLINQYTIAGADYASSYSNQQDYLNRIPMLVNDALLYTTSSAKKLRATYELKSEEGEPVGDWRRYELPEDFLELINGLFLLERGDGARQFLSHYILQGDTHILIPADIHSSVLLEYYRRPVLVGEHPEDTDVVDTTPEVHLAICYYVAAHLVMQDDEFAYASLYNEFESKLARLTTPATTELHRVVDVYAFDAIGGEF